MDAAYATRAQFEAYVEGWTTEDSAALDRLLSRATDDIDAFLGDYSLIETGTWAGRKLDPATLTFAENRSLYRATCAQAQYRFEQGEEFFTRPAFNQVTGPEFTTSGMPGHVGPLAMRELSGTGLPRRMASYLSHARAFPSWYSF